MARYWRQSTVGLSAPATPSAGTLRGGQPLERAPWESVMRAQDLVCVTSRRVIMQASVGQARGGWRFTSGQPTEGARVAYALGKARLTSGCLLRGSVLYLPSGGVGGVPPDVGEGTISMDVTWTDRDGSTETHTVDVELAVSDEDDFEVSGLEWESLRELHFELRPPVDFDDPAEANAWSVSPTVEIEAYQVGATRIVDLCIYEVPVQTCMESDDPGDEWTSHVFATGVPTDASSASSPRPRTRRSETSPDGNPRGGTRLTMDVANAQRQRFGPHLLHWSNYQEDDAAPASGLVALNVASDCYMFDTSQSSWDDQEEGLSVSCGGYARDWRRNNGHVLGTADAEAAIPVVLRVYGDCASGTLEFRLHTSEHSWVSVELTTTLGWHEGYGLLKVGLNPSDTTVAQPFIVGITGGNSADIWVFSLERLD